MIWQPSHDAQLRTLWASGLSASRIASAMDCGLSRSSIIGRVHRLGLSGRAKAKHNFTPRPARLPRAVGVPNDSSIARSIRHVAARAKNEVPAFEGDAMVDLPADQSPDAVAFLDRRMDMCRWPLNDVAPICEHLVCGSPRDGGHSYCARHFMVSIARTTSRAMTDEERALRRVGALRRYRREEQARAFGGR